YFRVMVFSLLAIGYTALCCQVLASNLREDRAITLLLVAILAMHGVYYVARMVPWSTSGTTWLARPDFVPTVFENILVIVSLAYGILIMVNSRSARQLEAALQARRDLLGHISHDLRSPLTAIVDSARRWRAGERSRDYSQLIERHAHRQIGMIDDLLEFSRTESSNVQPQPVPGYLHAFLNEVCEQAELACERQDNRLERDFADDLPVLVSV